MRTDDFDYDLPPGQIAQEPLAERDASRLLVLDRATGATQHRTFSDLPDLLRAGDRLVVNDTRVVPARVLGTRAGHQGEIELLLLHPVSGRENRPTVQALARPARKLTAGTELRLGPSGTVARIAEELDSRTRLVEFEPGFDLWGFLEREGHVPLPPYIHRTDNPADRERYQTVFAAKPGAVAAPTAGLHFTPALLERLAERGVAMSRITLNVGPGTFRPVTEDDPRAHRMDHEYFVVTPETAAEIASTRAAGGRIVAVGTTVVRTLETVKVPADRAEAADVRLAGDAASDEADGPGAPTEAGGPGAPPAAGGPGAPPAAGPASTGPRWNIEPRDGWSELFIYPPYEFGVVDAMITNFHLPRSTLLMLVSAFAGTEPVRAAYREAVANGYRFYSYGDAMAVL